MTAAADAATVLPTSSRLKRTPPIGAPKATDTPAAAAADNTYLRRWRFTACTTTHVAQERTNRMCQCARLKRLTLLQLLYNILYVCTKSWLTHSHHYKLVMCTCLPLCFHRRLINIHIYINYIYIQSPKVVRLLTDSWYYHTYIRIIRISSLLNHIYIRTYTCMYVRLVAIPNATLVPLSSWLHSFCTLERPTLECCHSNRPNGPVAPPFRG